MPKTRTRAREKARLMFVGGESSSNAAIARELQLVTVHAILRRCVTLPFETIWRFSRSAA